MPCPSLRFARLRPTLLLCLFALCAGTQAEPLFHGEIIPAGDGPLSVNLADMNGDGITDAVTTNYAGFVHVSLGDGSGSFAAPTSFAADVSSVDLSRIITDHKVLDVNALPSTPTPISKHLKPFRSDFEKEHFVEALISLKRHAPDGTFLFPIHYHEGATTYELTLKNSSQEPIEKTVVFDSATLDLVSVVIVESTESKYVNKIVDVAQLGEGTPYNQRNYPAQYPAIPLSLPAESLTTLMLQVNDSGNSDFLMLAMDSNHLEGYQQSIYLKAIVPIAILLILAAATLFRFITTRFSVFLFTSLAIGSNILFELAHVGWIGANLNPNGIMGQKIAFLSSMVGLTLLSSIVGSLFLDFKTRFPKAWIALYVLSGYSALMIALFVVGLINYSVALKAIMPPGISVCAMVMTLSLLEFGKGLKSTQVYAGAWMILFITMAACFAVINQWMPKVFNATEVFSGGLLAHFICVYSALEIRLKEFRAQMAQQNKATDTH